ncbi:MAG TPA: FAD-dependent oxidoreductase [Saprospiraceae bacterium]|nr:FAD-dependent oxidoreductase [Saprospiraceae bacterium]
MKIIIVGGVAGGATAAARLRRLSEEHEIIIFEKSNAVSFANCGLPYHIGTVIESRDKLLLHTVQSLKSRYNLDVRLLSEVIAINNVQKTVTIKDYQMLSVYTESYDKLLLSPGAEAVRPPLEGIQLSGIYTLRNLSDMDRIMNQCLNKQQFVIIGAGFIGLEIAENLKEIGKSVQIVELGNQALAPVDFDIASFIHQKAKQKEIIIHLGSGVSKFEKDGNHLKVFLANGLELNTEVVILAIGVKPDVILAQKAGLQISQNGGIKVNEFLQTSDPNIYAVGDAIELTHFIHQAKVLIPLAWSANRQARLVADNIHYGNKTKYEGAIGTSILKFFELSIASTGLNEKILKRNQISYRTIIVVKTQHASYFPGAKNILLKVLFDDKGRILGAQAVGKEGVDKRIDIMATAIKAQMNIVDLQAIEIAYAPPFNSAKDLVNIVGYASENILNKDFETINYDLLEDAMKSQDSCLLDVRTVSEYQNGHIPAAININVDTLRDFLPTLDKNKKYIVYCQVGQRAYLACKILRNNGFEAVSLNGGFFLWNTIFQQD